jgi:hypothetical protein
VEVLDPASTRVCVYFIRIITANVQLENKNSARGLKELVVKKKKLIAGKPSVVK